MPLVSIVATYQVYVPTKAWLRNSLSHHCHCFLHVRPASHHYLLACIIVHLQTNIIFDINHGSYDTYVPEPTT